MLCRSVKLTEVDWRTSPCLCRPVQTCADLCSYWSCLKYTRFADVQLICQTTKSAIWVTSYIVGWCKKNGIGRTRLLRWVVRTNYGWNVSWLCWMAINHTVLFRPTLQPWWCMTNFDQLFMPSKTVRWRDMWQHLFSWAHEWHINKIIYNLEMELILLDKA